MTRPRLVPPVRVAQPEFPLLELSADRDRSLCFLVFRRRDFTATQCQSAVARESAPGAFAMTTRSVYLAIGGDPAVRVLLAPDAFPLAQWLICRGLLGRYSSTPAPDSHRVPVRRAGSIQFCLATGYRRYGSRILLAETARLKWPPLCRWSRQGLHGPGEFAGWSVGVFSSQGTRRLSVTRPG